MTIFDTPVGVTPTTGGRLPRPPAPSTAVLLVLALAVLVAIVSRGTPVWALLREGSADRGAVIAYLSVLCALGGMIALIATVLAHRVLITRRPKPQRLRTTLIRSIPITAAALAALSLLAISRMQLDPALARTGAPPVLEWLGMSDQLWASIIDLRDYGFRAGEGEEEQVPGFADPDSRGIFPLLMLLAGFTAAGVAGLIAWRWRRGYVAEPSEALIAGDDAGPDASDDVHAAVVDTIDAMLADPDPRTAIIGAYARLLEGLDACGSGRLDHEAPIEHLHRVLTLLRVRAQPLRMLIDLFQLARFSGHSLRAIHRDQALDALLEVANDLAGATGSARASPAAYDARDTATGRPPSGPRPLAPPTLGTRT